jgi:glycosyltransferase involved in cell wall biosynthesis
MSKEKQIRIVIASVLKPVNDTRMFGKLARSLSHVQEYEVHVIGQNAERRVAQSGIIVHALPVMKRLSLKRLIAPFRVLRLLVQIRPSLLIITTHELLGIALISRLLLRCRVVYDVQENYFYNILYTDSFPRLIKPFIAFYVRMKELLIAPFIRHFLLAEKGYEQELPFLRKNYTVIENKVVRPDAKVLEARPKGISKLLFTGTLAPTTGIFTAIEIAKGLHQIDPKITLSIIGYCPRPEILREIQNAIRESTFIQLIGGNALVPHETILESLSQADAGIIAYPENPSTKTSVPTKLYEYLGYRLPIILNNSPSLIQICKPYNAAMVYSDGQFKDLYEQLQRQSFYTSLPDFVYWESEQKRFLEAISRLLK